VATLYQMSRCAGQSLSGWVFKAHNSTKLSDGTALQGQCWQVNTKSMRPGCSASCKKGPSFQQHHNKATHTAQCYHHTPHAMLLVKVSGCAQLHSIASSLCTDC
jgi:hypothetical protein